MLAPFFVVFWIKKYGVVSTSAHNNRKEYC